MPGKGSRCPAAARLWLVTPDGPAPLRDWLDGFWDDAPQAFAEAVGNRMEASDARARGQDD